MTKVEHVLQLTKQIHDTQALLKQLNFELSSIITPERIVAPRHKKRLAHKVIRRSPKTGERKVMRARPKTDEQARAAVLDALRSKPMGVQETANAAHMMHQRAHCILRALAKEGRVKTESVVATSSDGRKFRRDKWTLS